MARFRGRVKGQRGEVSRLGGKSSGLQVNANGWHAGVEVLASYDAEHDKDVFEVWRTGGSNGGSKQLVARIVEGEPTNHRLLTGKGF